MRICISLLTLWGTIFCAPLPPGSSNSSAIGQYSYSGGPLKVTKTFQMTHGQVTLDNPVGAHSNGWLQGIAEGKDSVPAGNSVTSLPGEPVAHSVPEVAQSSTNNSTDSLFYVKNRNTRLGHKAVGQSTNSRDLDRGRITEIVSKEKPTSFQGIITSPPKNSSESDQTLSPHNSTLTPKDGVIQARSSAAYESNVDAPRAFERLRSIQNDEPAADALLKHAETFKRSTLSVTQQKRTTLSEAYFSSGGDAELQDDTSADAEVVTSVDCMSNAKTLNPQSAEPCVDGAKAGTTSAEAEYSDSYGSEVEDYSEKGENLLFNFLDRIPLGKGLMALLQLRHNTSGLRKTVQILESEELHMLVTRVETLPEFASVVALLQDMGMGMQEFLVIAHELMGMPLPDLSPHRYRRTNDSPPSKHRSLASMLVLISQLDATQLHEATIKLLGTAVARQLLRQSLSCNMGLIDDVQLTMSGLDADSSSTLPPNVVKNMRDVSTMKSTSALPQELLHRTPVIDKHLECCLIKKLLAIACTPELSESPELFSGTGVPITTPQLRDAGHRLSAMLRQLRRREWSAWLPQQLLGDLLPHLPAQLDAETLLMDDWIPTSSPNLHSTEFKELLTKLLAHPEVIELFEWLNKHDLNLQMALEFLQRMISQ